MNIRTSRVAAVAAGAIVLIGFSSMGAVAGSFITSAQIKDQTVRSVDIAPQGVGTSEIRDSSILTRDLSKATMDALKGASGAKGETGAKGDTGAKGPEGDQGDQGLQGEPGLANLIAGAGYAGLEGNKAHDYWAPHSYGETIETCPAGTYALGGGFSQDASTGTDGKYDLGGKADVQITVSAPYFQGAYEPVDAAGNFRADQWVVRGFNNGDSQVDVRAWVTCAHVAVN